MAKVRNLVIGCDGTWNDTEEEAKTNVFKLLDNCLSRNHETHYEEGVGTAHWEVLPGGIYGKGIDRQILGGYRFLRRMYADPNWTIDENKVFNETNLIFYQCFHTLLWLVQIWAFH